MHTVGPREATDPAYAAARDGVILIDRSHHGRVRVEGPDRTDLLQRLTTGDLLALAPGGGAPGLFLTSKGRVFEFFDVLAGTDHLLLALAGDGAARTREWIERFTFVEDVRCRDVTGETVEFLLGGPEASPLLARLGDAEIARLENRDHRTATIAGAVVVIGATAPLAGSPAFRLLTGATTGDDLRNTLVNEGARPATATTGEILRIESGWPAPGHELDERFNPLEADLLEAISFTKGCYTGQEVVARLRTYDKVQRRLYGVCLDTWEAPATGAVVRSGDTEIGTVTSAACSPGLGRAIALAYIERAHATDGEVVSIEGAAGTLSGLPFTIPRG